MLSFHVKFVQTDGQTDRQTDRGHQKLYVHIVEKVEIAQNEQFHLFPQCSLFNLYLKIL